MLCLLVDDADSSHGAVNGATSAVSFVLYFCEICSESFQLFIPLFSGTTAKIVAVFKYK